MAYLCGCLQALIRQGCWRGSATVASSASSTEVAWCAGLLLECLWLSGSDSEICPTEILIRLSIFKLRYIRVDSVKETNDGMMITRDFF